LKSNVAFFSKFFLSGTLVCVCVCPPAVSVISRHKLLYFINVPGTRRVRWLPVGHMEVLIKARTKSIAYIWALQNFGYFSLYAYFSGFRFWELYPKFGTHIYRKQKQFTHCHKYSEKWEQGAIMITHTLRLQQSYATLLAVSA